MILLTALVVAALFVSFTCFVLEIARTRQLVLPVFHTGIVVYREIRFSGMKLGANAFRADSVVSIAPFRLRHKCPNAIVFYYWLPFFYPQIVTPLAAKCIMEFKGEDAEVTVRLQLAAFIFLELTSCLLVVAIVVHVLSYSHLETARKLLYSVIASIAVAGITPLMIWIEVKRAQIATQYVFQWLKKSGKLIPLA